VAGVEACQDLQKERYAVKRDTSIIQFRDPGSVQDPLTEIAREGARQILGAEIEAFVGRFAEERLPDGWWSPRGARASSRRLSEDRTHLPRPRHRKPLHRRRQRGRLRLPGEVLNLLENWLGCCPAGR
jgi:hypothetical protein